MDFKCALKVTLESKSFTVCLKYHQPYNVFVYCTIKVRSLIGYSKMKRHGYGFRISV